MKTAVQITLTRRQLVLIGAAALAVALVAVIAMVRSSAAAVTPGATGAVGPTGTVGAVPAPAATETAVPAPGPATTTAVPATVGCPTATVPVTDAAGLGAALAGARPGASIRLADGVYSGTFTASTAGTADRPITLCGGPAAVLDGGGVKGGYALHLDGASYWHVIGFTVRNGQKGVMADRVQHTVIQGLTVEQIGDEAIHLRNFSTDNVVQGNVVRNTGLRKEKFGEGVYIGTAESNWATVSGGRPDASDRNVVRDNTISATTAESVDIKEGTTGGTLSGNTFDGGSLSGDTNDSWVDVKGNGWLIAHNTGRHSLGDGFQTHEILDGWGSGNTFTANTAQVDGPGYGFNLTKVNGNTLSCDNTATGAAKGLSNATCA